MIWSLQAFLKLCSMMGIKDQYNVGQLSNKLPFRGQGQAEFGPELWNLVRWYARFCKIEHNGHTKIIANFPRTCILGEMGNLGPMWAKIMILV